jgi:hypothetical protein
MDKSLRESLNDSEYKGEDYEVNPAVKNGPLRDRKCTDVLFLLIFFGFLGGMAVVSDFFMKNG